MQQESESVDPEIADAFISDYLASGFRYLNRIDEGVVVSIGGSEYPVSNETISSYWAHKEIVGDLAVEPTECSVASSSFVELLIENVSLGNFVSPRAWDVEYSDTRECSDVSVRIGPVSDIFYEKFRFEEFLVQRARRFARRPFNRETCLFSYSRRGLMSVRVEGLDTDSVESALVKAMPMVDACLFELLQSTGRNYRVKTEWDFGSNPSYRSRAAPSRDADIPRWIPRAIYNEDLLKFYHFANASPFANLAYLSYYQILEYYYDSVANEDLYSRIRQKIQAADFAATDSQMEKIYGVMRSREKAKEEQKLLLVLEKYVDPQEVLDFIFDFDQGSGSERWFNKKTLFGKDLSVSRERNHVLKSLSTRVKHIRNALVHSTDIYEQQPRHIPFTEEAKVLDGEVPLVQFLAEKVIESSAEIY